MSFQVGNTCYPTAVQAAQATASQNLGLFVSRGGEPFSISVTQVTATEIHYRMDGMTGSYTHKALFTPMSCNMLTVEDGIAMGWMVGGAWIAAWALMFLTRALRGDQSESSYGHS